MKPSHWLTAAALLCLSAGQPAFSSEISPAVYQQTVTEIAARLQRERATCHRLASYERSICLQVAEGREQLERAELAERYQPSDEHRFQLAMARVEAHHAIERQRCLPLEPTDRTQCMERARENFMLGKADSLISHRHAGAGPSDDRPMEQGEKGRHPHCQGQGQAQHSRQDCTGPHRHGRRH